MKSIEAKQTDADQNAQLLTKLYYKSFGDFSKFLRCLEITKQSIVVSLLSTSDTYSEEPLNDVTKSRLVRNHAKLVYLIDTKHNLLAELLACDCISFQQREYIESEQSRAKINRRLLDILRRGSEKDFNKFIDCLKKTSQEHVANVLLNDGAVVHVEAKTNISATEETCLVDRLKEILGKISSADREHLYQFIGLLSLRSSASRENLYRQLTEHVNELRSRDVEVIAFSKQNSI